MSDLAVCDYFAFLEKLSSSDHRQMEKASQQLELKTGEFVYHQGDTPDSVYIVEKGVVEIMTYSADRRQNRSVAYLSRGDIFGEMGVLNKQARVASIRTCSEVRLLKMEDQLFLKLLGKIPAFGHFLSHHLAQRLHRVTDVTSHNSYCVDFGGNLLNFDLLLIFQTISSSNQTGQLVLLSPAHDPLGDFFFERGQVRMAKFAHLEGIEALWQVFLQPNLEGSFEFQILKNAPTSLEDTSSILLDTIDLMMQSAGKRDHFQRFPLSLQKLEGTLTKSSSSDALLWDEKESEPLADMVWQAIQRKPQTLHSLWLRTHECALPLIAVIQKLVKTNQATLAD